MKKYPFTLLMIIISINICAQNYKRESPISDDYTQAQIQYGFVFGLNGSTITNSDMDATTGFHIGGMINIGLSNLSEGAYLNLQGLFSKKGANYDDEEKSMIFNSYYLEIPIHLGYKQYQTPDISIFGEIGPYFALGLFGNMKKYSIVDNKFNKRSSDIFGSNGMNRWDAGIGLIMGIEIQQKYQFSLGYDFGLTPVYQKMEAYKHGVSNNAQNRNFKASISLLF